jgi:acetyltransferase EpsM
MSQTNVVILGGSGIGMIACSILERLGGYRILGFLNDIVPVGDKVGKFRSFSVIGTSGEVERFIKNESAKVFVAYIGMTQEKETFEKIRGLNIPEESLLSIIDPTAIIPERYCEIGPGCLICPLAQLSADTSIGKGCILLPNAFIGHDTVLEDYVSVANNAAVGANVLIRKGCHVGTNASIRERTTIGSFSLVGMGSVVLQNVPECAIVAGNPARVIKVSE